MKVRYRGGHSFVGPDGEHRPRAKPEVARNPGPEQAFFALRQHAPTSSCSSEINQQRHKPSLVHKPSPE